MGQDFPTDDIFVGEEVRLASEILSPSDPCFDASTRPAIDQAMGLLAGVVDQWPVPLAAGTLPHQQDVTEQNLFRCLFGRDSLIIGDLLADTFPEHRENAVVALAFYQGTTTDPASEEEPGRIAHEVRQPTDPQRQRISDESGWQFPYYGSVDATLLWTRALADMAREHPSILERVVGGRTLAERAEAATKWLMARLADGGGIIRSRRAHPRGILNQVWKDSGDSYLTGAGRIATESGTGSVESVGEAYDALHAASWLATHSPHRWSITPDDLIREAALLTERLVEMFWCGDYFAMGRGLIDGTDTALDAIASNQWRLLDSHILAGDDMADFRKSLIHSVLDPDMVGPAGIRTLSASHPRYRPGGYHTGSSWPVDTTVIIRGLQRHGATREAADLAGRTVAAIEGVGGYPEFFRSDSVEDSLVTRWVIDVWDEALGQVNRVCQPPQMLQGWSVASYHWLRRHVVPVS